MENAFYDDNDFNYLDYWTERQYEHESERLAILKLIKEIPVDKRGKILDIGSGFGRIAKIYFDFFLQHVLLEPSKVLLQQSRETFRNKKNIKYINATADKLPISDSSIDTVIMVRVLHHIADPDKIFSEVCRVLKPGGYFILEFPNKLNFKSRLLRKRNRDTKPIDIRSEENKSRNTIPFFNFHPDWVIQTAINNSFRLKYKLSVSNFRNILLKKAIPMSFLLFLENRLQDLFAKVNFGPSIFVLLQKK